ncbi:MAG: ATP-grasp domain-containing protein [Ancrocorticia sp.]
MVSHHSEEPEAPVQSRAVPVLPADAPVLPVIVGNDIADYSLARIFHETAGLRSLILAEYYRGPVNSSSILDIRILPQGTLLDEERFVAALDQVARDFPNNRLLFLVNSDEGTEFVTRHAERLSDRWFLPYSSWETVTRVNSKEELAQLCASLGLAVPHRAVVSLSHPETWEATLSEVTFPIVVKPLSGADTNVHWKDGLRKIVECAERSQALEYFEALHAAGVAVELMIQDLILGDDTTQWVVNGYVDGRGEITVCASGRVLLGLHDPHLIGNAAMILLEKNDALISDAKRLIAASGLRGFFSLDVKIDPRDGVARWLDLNPRIGRSHYYMKVGGIDMAATVLADLEGRSHPYQTNSREGIYTVVPMLLASRRYLRDDALYRRVRRMRLRIGKRRIVNPLAYPADRHIKRTIYRILNGINQVRSIRRWYPRATDTGF